MFTSDALATWVELEEGAEEVVLDVDGAGRRMVSISEVSPCFFAFISFRRMLLIWRLKSE